MSQKRATRYPIARAIADELEKLISPYCKQLHVVGSLRRRSIYSNDIEFVVLPVKVPDLFGGTQATTGLDLALIELQGVGFLRPALANGPRLKRFQVPYRWTEGIGVQLDRKGDQLITFELYVVERHSLGYHLAIRTGPTALSRKMVTPRNKGGFLDAGCVCRDGRVWFQDEPLYLPTEKEFFEVLSVDYIEPDARDEFIQERRRR